MLIPAHNEALTIRRCIQAVQASDYPIERILVVADACTDSTAQLAKAWGAEVMVTWAKDKAAAQNLALPSITSDVVVGFDGDTFPDPHCIGRMIRRLQSGYDAVGATVLPAQPKGFFIRARRYAYGLGRRWWRWTQDACGRVQVLTGACYAFRTRAIQAIGGFPTVGISADMDATWALHRAGYRLSYVGEAVAYTLDPETFAAYRAQMRRWAAGYFQTMRKHRRGLLHPRAILVVWTGLFDMLMLPVSYAIIGWWAWHDPGRVRWYWAYLLGHLVLNTALVASVPEVGPKEALLGCLPYTIVNFYNKGLYLWSFFREWVLGKHYAAWTGRHGRATVITPMPRRRRWALTSLTVFTLTLAGGLLPTGQPPPLPMAAQPGFASGADSPRPRPEPPTTQQATSPVATTATTTPKRSRRAGGTTPIRTDTTVAATTGTRRTSATATTTGRTPTTSTSPTTTMTSSTTGWTSTSTSPTTTPPTSTPDPTTPTTTLPLPPLS